MFVHATSFPPRALRLKRNKLTICFASQVDDVCMSNDGHSVTTTKASLESKHFLYSIAYTDTPIQIFSSIGFPTDSII